jgi:hypothetical protein
MKTSSTAYSYYYNGQLADVQIWNSAVDPVLIANYDMRGGSGTTVTDRSGYGYTATLAGGYTWNTTGHNTAQNGSLTFNGTTGYAQANASLLQPATTSFSLSAWVYLTDTTKSVERTIISQPGTNRAPFYLMYNNTYNRWQLKMTSSDSTTATIYNYYAADPNPAATNIWTHLAGTYDATTHIARLYVNGNLVGTATGITTWTSTGSTWIGRSSATWWQGKVDSARIYKGVLSRDQIKQVMNS